MVAQAVSTARDAGANGQILVRGDSAYGTRTVIKACTRHGVQFSLVMAKSRAVQRDRTRRASCAVLAAPMGYGWFGSLGYEDITGRVYYASTSRRLIDDVAHLLLRMGVQSRITQTTKAAYRNCWFLMGVVRAANQIALLTKVGVHGERGVKAKEVVGKLAGRIRRPGTDTIPVEIWDQVRANLAQRNWSE